MSTGLPAKHYVDANGCYLGGFAGCTVVGERQDGERIERHTEDVMESAEVDVLVDEGDHMRMERRTVQRKKVVIKDVLDDAGKVVGTVPVSVTKTTERTVPLMVETEETIPPYFPEGAIEVPIPPDHARDRWRDNRWVPSDVVA